MLMQEKIFDFSAGRSSVGDYSPVVVAAAAAAAAASAAVGAENITSKTFANLCRHSSSPCRPHFDPYECSRFIPMYYTSKIFDDFDKYNQLFVNSSSTSMPATNSVPYFTMHLPLTPPPRTKTPPSTNVSTLSSSTIMSTRNGFAAKRTLDGAVKTTEPPENQRTQSVIMKVEDQRIVEIPTNELSTLTSQETEEEITTCKWTNCYRNFATLENLASHVTTSHAVASSTGLYYCQWEKCARSERGFNARYKMLVHVRTHTKEKPHHCNECTKRFSRAENLKIHIRSHSGEKPYVCQVEGCSKAYSNSSDRFKHTRTHSTEKPYFCKFPECNKRYTDPSSLRKHVKTFKHIVTTKVGESIEFATVKEPVSIFCPKPAREPCRQSPEYRVSLGNATTETPNTLYHHHKKTDEEQNAAASIFSISNDGLSNQCLSPMYAKRYQHAPPVGIYHLEHLFSGSANIEAPKILYRGDDGDDDDDHHITDFWIEDKLRGVGFEDDDCIDIEIELPLDLSLRKVVR